MQAKTILIGGMLLVSFAAVAGSAIAPQTCTPGAIVCTGTSGSDPFAHCDGTWVDAWAGGPYGQVCVDNNGDAAHVCVEASYDDNPDTCTADVHVPLP